MFAVNINFIVNLYLRGYRYKNYKYTHFFLIYGFTLKAPKENERDVLQSNYRRNFPSTEATTLLGVVPKTGLNTSTGYKEKARARAIERLKPLPGWEDRAQGKKLTLDSV